MDVALAGVEIATPGRRWLRLPERLPDLKGKWLTLYTIIWAIMLPLALIGAGSGAYIVLTTPTMWTPYGFSTTEDSEGLHVDSITSAAARAAGLKAGDYVVAVDGWRVPRMAPRAAARPHVVKPDGAVTTFTMRSPNGALRDVRLTRSIGTEVQFYRDAGVSRTVSRAVNFVGVLLDPALFIGAAILLFLRRRREAVPALLSLSFLMFMAIVSGDLLPIGVAVTDIVGGVATILLFGALFAFPSGRFEPRWTAIPFLLLPAVGFITGTIGFLLGMLYALLAVAALISRYRKVGPGPERLQLRWAFLGLVVAMILFAVMTAAQMASAAWQAQDPRWVAWQYAFIQPLAILIFIALAGGLIVSILRYRLYDADAVIGRSAAYGVLTLGFVGLFAGSEKLAELIGERYFEHSIGIAAGAIGAAVAAVCIVPLHNRVHRWAERRFQKPLYRLRHGLPPLVGDLRETSGIDRIAAATLDSVVDGVRARAAALLVGDELIDARGASPEEVGNWRGGWVAAAHDGIDCNTADALFPVRVPLEAEGHGRIGWLLLGPRPDGTLIRKADREAIEEVAEPVARAIQVAISRTDREERYERRFAALEKLVKQLRGRPTPRLA